MNPPYCKLALGQKGLIGDVIAGIHSAADVLRWAGRLDVIAHGSSQFGSQMLYLREDGRWQGERVFLPKSLAPVVGYPKVFDWDGDEKPDLVTLAGGEAHLWENQGGVPVPTFQHAGPLRIDPEIRRQLPGSLTQIEFVPVAGGWGALLGCDDWGDYWPGTASPWSNRENPKLGLGKSYDADGNWQGGPLRASVWMLDVVRSDGALSLVNPRPLRTIEDAPVEVMGTAAPAAVYLRGPETWDLVLGDFGDTLTYFRNVGSDAQPVFLPGKRVRTRQGALSLHHNMSRPRAVDWWGRGTVDLLVGQENGRLYLLRFLESASDGAPIYAEPVALQQRDPELSVGSAAVPVLHDWDGDGDQDLIVGDAGGEVHLFENVGDPAQPRFALPVKLHTSGRPIRILAGARGSIQGPAEAKYGYTCPTVADWDGDGLPDLILSDVTGHHTVFQNVGSRADPRLAEGHRIQLDGEPFRTVWRVRPWAFDCDSDGVLEYLTLDEGGQLSLYKRAPEIGPFAIQRWRELRYDDGTTIRLDGPSGHEGRVKLHVTDWDGDDVWDVLFGIKGGQPLAEGINEAHLFWLRNIGTNSEPVFRQPMALCDADGKRLAFGGHAATPNVTALEGRTQLLIGAEDGRLYVLDRDDVHDEI